MSINFLAIIMAAAISFILGILWYSPLLFAKAWVKEMGWSDKNLKKKPQEMKKTFLLYGIGNLVMAYVLANLILLTQSYSMGTGAAMGFWCWLGFLATTGLSTVAFEGRSWKLFVINQSYGALSLMLMGALIGAWR